MAEARTKQTGASVEGFLDAITNEQVRADSRAIAAIMQKAAKAEPEMWGSGIVGFGRRTQRYASGKEAQWMLIAFAPRKQNITLYLSPDFPKRDELLAKLGTHSCGEGCVYIKRLSDVHVPTLTKLIEASVAHARRK